MYEEGPLLTGVFTLS